MIRVTTCINNTTEVSLHKINTHGETLTLDDLEDIRYDRVPSYGHGRKAAHQ